MRENLNNLEHQKKIRFAYIIFVIYIALLFFEPQKFFPVIGMLRLPYFFAIVGVILSFFTCPVEVKKRIIKSKIFRALIFFTIFCVFSYLISLSSEYHKLQKNIFDEVINLETKFREGLISRKNYRKQRRKIEQRLLFKNREIKSLSEKFSHVDPKIKNYLRLIEISDIELETTSRDLKRTNYRYQKREITKDIYESLIHDYETNYM